MPSPSTAVRSSDPPMTEPAVSCAVDRPPKASPSRLRARFASSLSGPGAVSFVVATAGVGVSNFVFHVVSSRLLGPSHYGGLGALLNVLTLLAVPLGAVQLAVTQAVVRGREQGRRRSIRRLTGQGAFGGLLAAALLVALAPVLSGFLHLGSVLAVSVLALWLPLASAGSVLQGALIGELRFTPVAIAIFLGGGPVRLGLGAALTLLGGGVVGAIGATVGAQAVTTVLLVKAARPSLSKGGDQLRAALGDTAVSALALAGYTVLTGIDTFLAQHFLAAASAGQYAAAAIAGHIALFLPGAVVMVAFPQLAEGRGRSARSRTAFAQAFLFTSALGLVAAGVLALFAPRVVAILFGRAYQPAASAVGILGLESAVLGLVGLLTYFHIARHSRMALLPWAGGALAAGTVALFHGSLVSIATGMLLVAAAVFAAALAPALSALVRSAASESAVPVPAARLCEAPTLDLTVVVPFYNPGPRFAAHLGQVVDALEAAGATFEVLAVSDGSTDGSSALAEGLRPEVVRVLSFDQNQGKGAALRAGFDAGHGRWLGFIDGDGDLPGALLTRFVELVMREEPDVLLGSKRHPTSQVAYPPLRRLYSWAYQQLNRVLFHLPVRDTQTGVKFVRRDVLADVLPRMLEKRYAFDLELLVVAWHLGYRRFTEAPVTIVERFTSTISLRAVWHMLIDTLAIFSRLRVLHHYGSRGAHPPLPFPVSPALAAPVGAGLQAGVLQAGAVLQASAVPTERVRGETTPSLRILVCNWKDSAHPRAGGAEVYTADLAREWAREGHSVTLFCAAVRGRPEVEDVDGVRVVRRGGRFGVYRAARRFFQEAGGAFDLVVDEVNTRPFFCPRFARDVPVVALIHQVCREVWDCMLPWPLSWLGRHVLEPRWLAAYRDVPVVTVSESSRSALEAYGLRHVAVVPEGQLSALEQTYDAPAVREAVPTVVFVGRLSRSKRPEHALRAFEIYRRLVPEAQMWVIGTGPEESRLRRLAPCGVTFLGRVTEEEKVDRLARADVLVATSVREGWGLVVSEAAAVGTPTVAYDVPGLRDSVGASGGVLTPADPAALADALVRHVPNWRAEPGPVSGVDARGLLPWGDVAALVLATAQGVPARSTVRLGARRRTTIGVLAPTMERAGRVLAWLGVAGVVGLGVLDGRSPGAVVAAIATATLAGAVVLGAVVTIERRGRTDAPAGARDEISVSSAARSPGGWRGAAAVALIAVAAAQTWFAGGAVIAGGDIAPPYGLAWMHHLFGAWVWSGSNLGGPGALEVQAPWAAVLLVVHALGGGAPLAQRIWLSSLYAAAGLSAYALLRLLRLGAVASVVGALVYLFNPYTLTNVGVSAVYLCAMVLLAAYPAIVLTVATGRWRLRTGVMMFALGSPLIGYAYQNPPLVLMVAAATVVAALGASWVYRGQALRRAARLLASGVPVLVLACAYWIVPSWLQLHSVATRQLSSLSSWTWTEGRANLANGLWLNTTWGWRYAAYYPYAHLYGAFPLDLVKFLLPAVAFWSLVPLVFRSGVSALRTRVALVSAAIALGVVFFSTGTNAPGSIVFDPLYHLPYGWTLQDPGRFLMAAGLAYGALVGLAFSAASELLGARARAASARVQRVPHRLRLTGTGALAVVAALVAVVPGFPLISGAVVLGARRTARVTFPSSHVSLPAYWADAAAYLNARTPHATVLVLPPDDFYQMPYTWYYGNDGFITDLLDAHVIDPSAQGYGATSSASYLNGVVDDVATSLLAGDWPLVRRLLGALGANEILLRGDVEAQFPSRHIVSPAALARALARDPTISLLHRDGPLRIYKVHEHPLDAVRAERIVTVASRSPDLRELALFPAGTALVTSAPRRGLPAVSSLPPLSRWQMRGRRLETSLQLTRGRRYRIALLGPTSSRSVLAQRLSSRLRRPFHAVWGTDARGPWVRFSLELPRPLLADGSFERGAWGPVGNCDAAPGTTASAHLHASVLRTGGPGGAPALELSAAGDAACESETTTWRRGPVLLSLWTRHLSGAAPALCLWEEPIGRCAPVTPLPASRSWSRFSEIVTPTRGTRQLSLFLYAYGPSTAAYADVSLTPAPSLDLPVVVGTPITGGGPRTSLLVSPDAYGPGWSAPSHASYVRVDGARGGWLTSGAPVRGLLRYAPTQDIWRLGFLPSLAAAGIVVALLGTFLPEVRRDGAFRRRRRRWRSRRPPLEAARSARGRSP